MRDNLTYGKSTKTSDKDIWNALKLSNAYEFVALFPEKLETIVGNLGRNLSVGQRQRVVLARSLLLNPSVIILDEPTSAIDTKSAKYILDALEILNKKYGITIILVTHHLEKGRRYDKVINITKDNKS